MVCGKVFLAAEAGNQVILFDLGIIFQIQTKMTGFFYDAVFAANWFILSLTFDYYLGVHAF